MNTNIIRLLLITLALGLGTTISASEGSSLQQQINDLISQIQVKRQELGTLLREFNTINQTLSQFTGNNIQELIATNRPEYQKTMFSETQPLINRLNALQPQITTLNQEIINLTQQLAQLKGQQ